MTEYIDWVPLKEVDGFKINDVLIVRKQAFAISSFPSETQVLLTQIGEYNPNENMELELHISNLKEAVQAGRVIKHGRIKPIDV